MHCLSQKVHGLGVRMNAWLMDGGLLAAELTRTVHEAACSVHSSCKTGVKWKTNN